MTTVMHADTRPIGRVMPSDAPGKNLLTALYDAQVLAPPGSRVPDTSAPEEDVSLDAAAPRSEKSRRVVGLVRAGCGAALFVAVLAALARSWRDVGPAISEVGPASLLASEALVLAGLGASVLTWRRAVLEVGSHVRLAAAAKIYLVGQLGKYLPGSLWAVAAQTELAQDVGVPRSRGATASIVAVGMNLVTGLALGLAIVPSVLHRTSVSVAVVIPAIVLVAAALTPPVLTRIANACLRVVRRPVLERDISWAGVGTGSAWSVTTWLAYGVSVWLIAVAIGAPAGEALPLCVAGVPLAMNAGLLVFVAPSGIGIREAVLVAALAPVLDHSDAFAVALVARVLFTVADLVAAIAVLPVSTRRREAV
jgi:hypothetical protein